MSSSNMTETFYIPKTTPFESACPEEFQSLQTTAASPMLYVPLHGDITKAVLSTIFSASRHGFNRNQWDSADAFYLDRWPLPAVDLMQVETDSHLFMDVCSSMRKDQSGISHYIKWYGSVGGGKLIRKSDEAADESESQLVVPARLAVSQAQLTFELVRSTPIRAVAECLRRSSLHEKIDVERNTVQSYLVDMKHYKKKASDAALRLLRLQCEAGLMEEAGHETNTHLQVHDDDNVGADSFETPAKKVKMSCLC
jgi:predicted DCC family thiol-disulfide oxidoreductase YuxK